MKKRFGTGVTNLKLRPRRFTPGGTVMKIRSSVFEEEQMIPSKYTRDGEDVSPPLSWDDVPEEAKSFALISDDPDAPGGNWVHWLVCDIPANVREIPEGSVPEGARQVKNDFGKPDYGGPAPPSGVHRYYFKLYALDVEKLSDVNDRNFYSEVEKHSIASTSLMGKYTRNR
jgi:Raf kinase inhibitor-like YbhB/YbcL family protein